MTIKKDYTGAQFGRLTVVGDDEKKSKPGKRHVIVSCECGVKKSTRLDALVRGVTVSCGCKKAEHALRHGHRRVGQVDPTYTSWDSMWQRCTNPNTPGYRHYGARGIGIDPRWKDFSAFKADMGVRPSPSHSIERKDNEKGYSKENCVWATRQEQMSNTRRVIRVRYKGRSRVLKELAVEHGLDPALVRQRFNNGWSVHRALTTPKQRGK